MDHDSTVSFTTSWSQWARTDGNKPATAEIGPVRAMLDSLSQASSGAPGLDLHGADDDASGSMAMLEVAEAFATARRNRSARSCSSGSGRRAGTGGRELLHREPHGAA